jgi:hypothetical protein
MYNKVYEYKVVFNPENNYGGIIRKAYSKKEALCIYHELKNALDDVRPGHLSVIEVYKNGQQKFAVNYETGKKVNGRKIIKQIDELSKYLVNNVYNQAKINRQIDEYNKLPLDAIHILEFLDTSELSDEIYKDICIKLQLTEVLRRQYKNDIYDAKSIANQLKEISKQLQAIKMKLDNNQSQRSNDKNRNIEYEKYLKSFDIDIEKYKVVIEKEADLDNVNL